MASRGTSSTLSIISARNTRSSGATGANVTPQLPMSTVVTPCHELEVINGSHATCASRCVCRSMKPGETIRPAASISRVAVADDRSPMAEMRSPSMATSAR